MWAGDIHSNRDGTYKPQALSDWLLLDSNDDLNFFRTYRVAALTNVSLAKFKRRPFFECDGNITFTWISMARNCNESTCKVSRKMDLRAGRNGPAWKNSHAAAVATKHDRVFNASVNYR